MFILDYENEQRKKKVNQNEYFLKVIQIMINVPDTPTRSFTSSFYGALQRSMKDMSWQPPSVSAGTPKANQ